MRKYMAVAALIGGAWILLAPASRADEKVPLDKIPEKIMAAIKDRFPDAELTSVEKEIENGISVFDVELKQKGRKFEAEIKEDGTIIEIEKETAAKDFPAACADAIKAKYPQAKIEEIMEVNKVEGKKETPIHYECVLSEPGKKSFEVVVALDGKTVEQEKE
jgi:Putative beta-lactamase-inhibitor-like, PepSY-like